MKYILLLVVILALPILAQIAITPYQAGPWAALVLEPEGDGAYVIIFDNLDSMLWSGIVETTITVTLPICPPESIQVRFTPLFTPDITEIEDLGDRIAIPGGWFRVGADSEDVAILSAIGMPMSEYNRALPQRWAFLDSFEIAKNETPCSLYSIFVDSGGYAEQTYWSAEGWAALTASGWTGPAITCIDSGFPVRGVSYFEVEAYANWLGASLPTELQWEIAARLDAEEAFPWGDVFCPGGSLSANINDANQCDIDTFDGGPGYPEYFAGDISPTGCLSMGGNVAEWCRDSFVEYDFYLGLDPLFPYSTGGGWRSVRGGDYTTANRWRCSPLFRLGHSPSGRDAQLGFRVVWEIGDGAPNDWDSLDFIFDCEPPDTVALVAEPCLKSYSGDTVAFVFTEPMIGEPVFLPDSTGVDYEFVAETLFIIIEGGAFDYGDSLGIIISDLTDTVLNPLAIPDTFYFVFCLYEIELNVEPQPLCAPLGCSVEATATLINLGVTTPILLDSVVIGGDFYIYDFIADTFQPSDTIDFTILFDPDSAGVFVETLTIYHADGYFEEVITATACDSDSVYFAPSEIEVEDLYSSQSWDVLLQFDICEDCLLFNLRVTDAAWAFGTNFTDDLTIGDSLSARNNTIAVTIDFNPSANVGDDTLTITFTPDSARCDESYTAILVMNTTAVSTDCIPTPECRGASLVRPCDAVKGTESIYFVGICEGTVSIYDRLGRFIIELEPDAIGAAEWKLTDKNGAAVPSGIYYWASGEYNGNIVIIR